MWHLINARKKLTKVFFIVSLLMIFSGCSLMDSKFGSETMAKVEKSEDITSEEKAILKSAVTNADASNSTLEGKKISEIINTEKARLDEIKRIEEEERRKKEEEERIKAEEERKRKEELDRIQKEKTAKLKNTVKVTLDGKGLQPENVDKWQFNDIVTMDFTFTNTGSTDVRAFQGMAKFKDILDNKIIDIRIVYDKPIKTGETIKWPGAFEINEFMDDHVKLMSTEFINLKMEFDTTKIIFVDGSTLE